MVSGLLELAFPVAVALFVDRLLPTGQWGLVLMRRLPIQGFIILDYFDRYPEAIRDLVGWMADGRLKTRQDVRDGLDRAIEHLNSLYTGGNFGKLLVRVSPDAEG